MSDERYRVIMTLEYVVSTDSPASARKLAIKNFRAGQEGDWEITYVGVQDPDDENDEIDVTGYED